VTEQSADIPKARWVDGTPEHSFHVCGLRKLLPNALFVHIVRNVTSVVRSMLNFHRIAGVSLVASEQEAYDYWFRAVSACLLAEQAYGLGVVFRLRYSELVDQPEASLRSLRNFLGEPFAAECLIPSEKESTVPMYPLISSLATQHRSSSRRACDATLRRNRNGSAAAKGINCRGRQNRGRI
jgi:hypothetical protein